MKTWVWSLKQVKLLWSAAELISTEHLAASPLHQILQRKRKEKDKDEWKKKRNTKLLGIITTAGFSLDVPFPYCIALWIEPLLGNKNRNKPMFFHKLFFQLDYYTEHGTPPFLVIAYCEKQAVWPNLSKRQFDLLFHTQQKCWAGTVMQCKPEGMTYCLSCWIH